MPTQSRGFFTCDFCGVACDTFDEASEHEAQCAKRPLLRRYGMAPLSSSELEGYMMHGTPHHGPPKLRAVALMGANDRGSGLSPDDTIACQSIELFEASPENAADFDASRTGGTPVVPRQVGLRCAHCATSPMASSDYSTLFPASLGSIASNVRLISDNHLPTCRMAPPEIRETCDRAAKRRQDENEGRNATEDDDRSRMALLDYCVGLCKHLGIVNKQPHKTGITFADLELPPTPADTPAIHRGLYGPPFSSERMGPPYDHRMFPTPGGPPYGRPGMPPMMGGPIGPGDAIAPTPLQRRRDRPEAGGERGPPMYSADRSEGENPSTGYPTPYSEGRYGHDIQTPMQPNFEAKEGPTPHSVPPSAHGSEASPPGYNHYDLPSNFPFYQESDRTWHCKFCSHIHPSYRDPQAIWSSSNGGPPPGNFIDSHLSMCRAYHQSMPSPPMYHAPPYGPPYMPGYPPPWDTHSPPQMPPPHMPYPPPHPGEQYPYPPVPPDEYGDRVPRGPPPMGMPPHGPPPARPGPQPSRKENVADAVRNSIAHLMARESEYNARNPDAKTERLVLDEDKLLLTDYFFHLMKQLKLCRFSESDRKTRGGKREKIKIGYGGLQCIHCADIPNSRKFFWSNVDRLANSFAEIPGHVLKCRRCPMQTKDALMQLKQFHPEQMARLPRGSQKVFFRRMWRRLHDEDAAAAAVAEEDEDTENANEDEKPETPMKDSPDTKSEEEKSLAEESLVMLQRSTKEAAKALADAAHSGPPSSPFSRVLLAIPDDKEWLSDMDCYIRKQLEVFCATEEDVEMARSDRKYPVQVGQVGIRCIHCSLKAQEASGTAVAFPFAISGIYEAVREFQRLHLDSCDNVPAATKEKLNAFKGASSLSSVLRKYYVLAAKALGLHDTREGIRSGGECVPLGSQAAFSFAEGGVSMVGEDVRSQYPPAESERKRPEPSSVDEPALKKVKREEPSKTLEESNLESPSIDEGVKESDSADTPTDGLESKEKEKSPEKEQPDTKDSDEDSSTETSNDESTVPKVEDSTEEPKQEETKNDQPNEKAEGDGDGNGATAVV